MKEKAYLHGYNEIEQKRLVSQSKFLEEKVFEKIDYSECENILEIGCGVGAQTEILLQRYPKAHITGIDISEMQLNSAKHYLNSKPEFDGRYTLLHMSADDLKFENESFDGVYICWVLEHLSNPTDVLKECRRVLSTNGLLTVTEVQNSNLHLEPHSDFIEKYWCNFNRLQLKMDGDPFVGVKIGKYLYEAGFNNTDVYPQTFFYDKRDFNGREKIVNYWTELLLSGFDTIYNNGLVAKKDRDLLISECDKIKNTPEGIFFYSFMQGKSVK